jgi:N-acetyl-anhydromuramyl-L-alanine amidase AmpD
MITTSIIVLLTAIWKFIEYWLKSKSLPKQITNETKVSEVTTENTIKKEETKNSTDKSVELFEIEPSKPVIKTETKVEINITKKEETKIKDDLSKTFINQYLPKNQYVGKRKKAISQIYIHFTEGGSVSGCINTWKSNSDKIATNFILDKNGDIYCVMPEDSWAYQLGIRFKSNKIDDKFKTKEWSDNIEQMAIGVEVVNEGSVKKNSKGFYFEGGDRYIEVSQTVRLPMSHRGYFDYVDFTDEQYKSLEKLLHYLTDKYNIPKNYTNPFSVNLNALNGVPGIFTHVCVRHPDKNDCAPLPKLVKLLKELNS